MRYSWCWRSLSQMSIEFFLVKLPCGGFMWLTVLKRFVLFFAGELVFFVSWCFSQTIRAFL